MKLTTSQPKDWKDLQNRVAEILKECNFNVEIEKKAETARGKVELDVYAEEKIKGRKYSIVCECKYWKANIPQNIIHGFRSVVSDLGCNIGYVITTSDFQSGSKSTSEYSNVELLTWENFQSLFFESWFESYFSPQMTKRLDPLLTYTEPLLPKWFHIMEDKEKKAYRILKDRYDLFCFIINRFTTYARILNDNEIPSIPLIDRFKENPEVLKRIPTEILTECGYKEFLEKCFKFGEIGISDFRRFRDKYSENRNDEYY